MGAGIAVMFKKEFKGVEELKEQSESALFINNSSRVKMSYFGVLIPRRSFCSEPRNLVLCLAEV